MTDKAFPGVGNLNFFWMRWGKLKRRFQVSNDFFFRVPKSLTAINTCLDDMKDFKRRDIAISQVTVCSFLENELSNEFWLRNSCLSYYRVKTIW